MIVYFANRGLSIVGHASTALSQGYRIVDDLTTESVETGGNTLNCVVAYTPESRRSLEYAVQVGNFILKQSDTSDPHSVYDSLYQIIDTEQDVKAQEITLYAEDAGLDLLNTICGATTLSGTLEYMMGQFLPTGWSLNPIAVPNTTKTYTWDGDSTATERLMSVANLFDCEIYYSFVIEQLQIQAKVINVVNKRGNQVAVPQLRLNYELDNIITKRSIEHLITAYRVTGGTPEGGNAPINLVGYSYTYTDPSTGDVYTVDTATGQMRNTTAMATWASVLDTDGLMVGTYSFDTTDQAVLAGQARAQLQKTSQPEVNYEVDFAQLPDGVRIGDRINIIDDQGGLYLEARLLEIETSVTDNKKTAVIGEYLLRDSGIADKVAQLASDFANLVQDPAYTLEITSSAGAVYKTTTVATTLTAHIFLFGQELSDSAIADIGTIYWYNYDDLTTALGSGKTYTITEDMAIDAINITARLEN